MNPRLLKYYNQELLHLREMGREFAQEFPKVAGRLGLEGLECADPYVERLLEGFAFLAARVHLKLDAEYPRFTQHLLEMVYPHYLAPTPSLAVVQLKPDLSEGALGEGFVVPRDTSLRTPLGKGETTPCEYRTAHEVTLWPLELAEARYFTGGLGSGGGGVAGAKAGLRFRLRTTAGLTFDQLALERLPLFLQGGGELPVQIYERLLANVVGIVAEPASRPAGQRRHLREARIRQLGFGEREALLPYGPRSFQGYRLLHEYFSFPARFLFLELDGLGAAVRQCTETELEVTVLFDRSDPHLESALDASQFALFCTPAVNLFPLRADRIHVNDREHEYHIVPDRTRPTDFEVYDVTGVVGHGTSADEKQEFQPFYASKDRTAVQTRRAYYTVHRTPRTLSGKQRRQGGGRSGYVGSEIYLALVDAAEAPHRTALRQLSVTTRCTNRDLPLYLTVGQGKTDFTLQTSAPVASVRCLAGPTRPRAPYAEGEAAWRLISHLSLNYLSLSDSDAQQGAAALRELLGLYGGAGEASRLKQVEGVRSVVTRPINRRLPVPGPITFGRGLEVELTLDEGAFGGSGAFLLGAVLEQFFARYVSLNSFTETVVKLVDRGEVMRWPARIGQRQLL